MTLICPKCGSDMRAYERNGVTIDQCTGCRGIFLDRGELERLTDAESAYYGSPPAAAPTRYPEERYREDYPKKKRRPSSFLGDLFD
jgi:Zn-finger nucleic acid-binding protein